jgi:hypothetical protein
MPSKTIEGLLYTEVNGRWIEVFCWVRAGHFEAFDRQKAIALTNTGNWPINIHFLNDFEIKKIVCN